MEDAYKDERFLMAAREEVQERDKLAEELSNLKSQDKKLSKSIEAEEKNISDEIASTVKKQRSAIVDKFEKLMDENEDKQKEIENQRAKKKKKGMNARIEDQTADLHSDISGLKDDMNKLLRKNQVPKFVGSKLYFAMFMPRGLAEMVGMIIGLVIMLLGVPTVVMSLIRTLSFEKKLAANPDFKMSFWCTFIVVALAIVMAAIYFLIYRKTRGEHANTVKDARKIMNSIKKNEREIASIKKGIQKDKDESHYNLESFDEKLDELHEEARAIEAQKKLELQEFDEQTKEQLVEEIKSRHIGALENLKEQKAVSEQKVEEATNIYQDKVAEIKEKYGTYIGEELCKVNKINALLAILRDGQADSLEEAVSMIRK